MAPQSRAPTVLLTRPAAQSARFAADLRARHPDLTLLTSPLLTPTFLSPDLPDTAFTALILTSETAVRAARLLPGLPIHAFCVGTRTARAATAAGFAATSADGDVTALFTLITTLRPKGPLLHLHGRDTTGDLGARLNSAGIETVSVPAYDQTLQPLSPQATALLRSTTPILAPVFSPRSARALASECARIHATAPLTVVAISPAAAAAFPDAIIAATPDAAAVLQAITSWLKPATLA